MLKTVQISDELAQLLGPDERLSQALTEVVVLELFRERRIPAGKAAELLELSYREFLDLLQAKNIPVVRNSEGKAGGTWKESVDQRRSGGGGVEAFEGSAKGSQK